MRIKHIIEYLKRQNRNKLFVCLLLAIICFIPAILAVLFAPIYVDSGYYLAIVERINDGYKLYTDIKVGYAPLTFYMWYLLKTVFQIGINYEFYLTIHFIIQFLSAFFLYIIAYEIIKRRFYAFLCSVMFLLVSHWNEGNYVLLETPSIMWGLFALAVAVKSKKNYSFFGVGLLCSFSFLSKQYGIIFLFLSSLLLLFENKGRVKISIYTALGFIIPVIICFTYWGNDFWQTLNGAYGQKVSFTEHTFKIYDAVKFFLTRLFPVLLIGILYLPFIFKNVQKSELRYVIILIVGIGCFFLQFYFWTSFHYYLYIIPFASILTFYILRRSHSYRWLYLIFLMLTCSYTLYSVYFNRVYKVYTKHRNIKIEQINTSKIILSHINNHKTLYLCGLDLIPQYYLTNICPPNLKEIAYTFGPALNNELHLRQLESADYVIISKVIEDYDYYQSKESNDFFKKRQVIYITPKLRLYSKYHQ